MLELDERDFSLENLPYEVDIHNLEEGEHRRAFLETFSLFLAANTSLFMKAEKIEFEAKEPMDWTFEGSDAWKSSLIHLAEMSYDSWNDEVILNIEGRLKILFVMDNPYYAKL